MAADAIVDVIQVGFGPGGQSLAALLGHFGHSVAVFERYPYLYNLPRAGHIDHEVLRTVQVVGDAEKLVETMWEVRDDYVWLNADREQLMLQPLDPGTSVSGWFSDFTLWQPNLEDVLHGAAVESGVEINLGWDVVGLRDDGELVEVVANRVVYDEKQTRTRTEEYRTLHARYVVASDGANSFVRTTLGIEREDHGFNEKWLDVDMKTLRPHTFEPNIAQIADPARPRMFMPLGKDHRRFEWMLLPGETDAELEDPAKAWQLLEEFGVTPETHEISRQIVYLFQARTARSWRKGRVFLGGDAAHTMPPYAGQGLCSAVRDSTNLAWKLDLVLRGAAPDLLLDTYELERRPHVEAWTKISIEEGKVSCELDPVKAAERDAWLLSGAPLPIPEFPQLESGVLQRKPWVGPVGELGLQGRVRFEGREGLFDDVFGGGRFTVVALGGDPAAVLSAEQLAFLAEIRAVVARVESEPAGDGAAADLEGRYASYFEEHGLAAVLTRPDYYVFGGAATLADLPSLVDDLRDQLRFAEVSTQALADGAR